MIILINWRVLDQSGGPQILDPGIWTLDHTPKWTHLRPLLEGLNEGHMGDTHQDALLRGPDPIARH
jgi:hypothetical protein